MKRQAVLHCVRSPIKLDLNSFVKLTSYSYKLGAEIRKKTSDTSGDLRED